MCLRNVSTNCMNITALHLVEPLVAGTIGKVFNAALELSRLIREPLVPSGCVVGCLCPSILLEALVLVMVNRASPVMGFTHFFVTNCLAFPATGFVISLAGAHPFIGGGSPVIAVSGVLFPFLVSIVLPGAVSGDIFGWANTIRVVAITVPASGLKEGAGRYNGCIGVPTSLGVVVRAPFIGGGSRAVFVDPCVRCADTCLVVASTIAALWPKEGAGRYNGCIGVPTSLGVVVQAPFIGGGSRAVFVDPCVRCADTSLVVAPTIAALGPKEGAGRYNGCIGVPTSLGVVVQGFIGGPGGVTSHACKSGHGMMGKRQWIWTGSVPSPLVHGWLR